MGKVIIRGSSKISCAGGTVSVQKIRWTPRDHNFFQAVPVNAAHPHTNAILHMTC